MASGRANQTARIVDLRAALARYERQHIKRVLDACGGDKREAARRLGMGLSSLYRKLEEMTSRP